MARQAIFEGTIYDENDNLLATAVVGGEAQYVFDDDGFHRHIDAEIIDRQVLAFFLEQLQQNRDIAVQQALQMLGSDDLMTKAAVDSSLRNITMDQILAQGVPTQAREMLAMMGFRVVVNMHGEVLRMDQPSVEGDEDGE
ncbi:MAG: hypothetical protein K1X50_06800 [Candidatus Promineofilum sp.]|nr:hypothetical protein [Promineifilum sp.]MCW5862409.1 hypothetical protein [Anaerolineae bacterium]